MAIVERGEAFYVKVHRGCGRYEHVGTFRWDEHGGKRAARRAAERAEADAHERRQGRQITETCDEFALRWPGDYPTVKHGPTRGRARPAQASRGRTESRSASSRRRVAGGSGIRVSTGMSHLRTHRLHF